MTWLKIFFFLLCYDALIVVFTQRFCYVLDVKKRWILEQSTNTLNLNFSF